VNNGDGSAQEKGRPLLRPACTPPPSRIKDATRRFAVPKRASLPRLAVGVLVRLQGRDEEQDLSVRTRNTDDWQCVTEQQTRISVFVVTQLSV